MTAKLKVPEESALWSASLEAGYNLFKYTHTTQVEEEGLLVSNFLFFSDSSNSFLLQTGDDN
jgi:hypothetical protein